MKKKYTNINTQIFSLRISFFLIILLWVLGFSFPLIFSKSDSTIVLYPILHKFYSGVCHQLDYKSFSALEYHFLVCSRCTGIYFGALIASLLSLIYYNQNHLKIKYLYLASVPMLIDVLFQSMNFIPYLKISALTTGLIFGFTVFVFFLSVIENSFIIQKTKISLQ